MIVTTKSTTKKNDQPVREGHDRVFQRMLFFSRVANLTRACRKTPLRVMGCLLASLLPLYGSCFCSSVCPEAFSLYLLARTTSRISLFRLNETTERGPAISSVCHRRSLGLLTPYLSVFSPPMIP